VAEMSIEQIFYNTVVTSWHLAFLVGYFGLDDLGDEYWGPNLLHNNCGQHCAFPPPVAWQAMEDAIVEARYGGLQVGREALHTGAGGALRPAEALIAEARDVISFSQVLTPSQAERILQAIDEVMTS
jgi:hypothetical protein